ncbi:hypothetical protein ACJMK2_027596 [Sinanodonta woodiana]|uniref:Uncharacterized protein n=1 Tax=Sinanodonta woodiana TaxID=1069815 RepID=A0ABD3X821_SINWO
MFRERISVMRSKYTADNNKYTMEHYDHTKSYVYILYLNQAMYIMGAMSQPLSERYSVYQRRENPSKKGRQETSMALAIYAKQILSIHDTFINGYPVCAENILVDNSMLTHAKQL